MLCLSGVVRKVVEGGSDVILPCSLSNKQDIVGAVFDWKKVAQKGQRQKEVFFYDAGVHYNNGRPGQSEQFKKRVSHFEDQLKHGIASISIRNTKMADSGNYSCAFPRLQTPQTFYIELVVVAAAPEPFIRTLDATDVWALLQCEVRGASPQPAVEWQDSDGNRLPAEEPQVSARGGSYDVTLYITLKKTGRYRCVVEQEDIKHRMTSETFVHISKHVPRDWIGWVAGFIFGGVSVLAVQALLVYRKCITIRRKNSPHQQGQAPVDKKKANRDISSCGDPSGLLPESKDAS
ncbi:butyrophilin-like protein 10 [Anarrhichthys ocellatus]|uniref:butyrophilin-like protein 10 n=1 Tax=Anarrhichthys ocellatus TaxID=433405 RepID=UPI0012EE25EF|nr:butyrophilin-like protein 10 [Anarrhichthys ocellatus]